MRKILIAVLLSLAGCHARSVAGGAAGSPSQSTGASGAGGPVDAGGGAPSDNPISRENLLPGDSDWQVHWSAPAHALEGYASAVSVNHGEPIDLHLSADGPHAVQWELFRLGYYGGAGARRLATGSARVQPQPLPKANATTGLVECNWPASFTIQTDATWPSGIYLVRLTRDDGPQQYVPFVVRADEHRGAAVFQSSVTTWQAYNAWGGESLYTDSLGLSGGKAKAVSFNRPYDEAQGSGQLFRYELPFLQWAESRGYDLVYLTDVDLDRDGSLLDGQNLFMSVGHDEYWSGPQRDAVQRAIDAGASAAFFSGNSVYWQIRLEPAADGSARRTEVCWKDAQSDPHNPGPDTTVQWRQAPVNRPEDALLGVMFDAWELADSAWVVRDASHWLYANTGVHEGDTIPLIVGYEVDRTWSDATTPANVERVASAPVLNHEGAPSEHDAVVYAAPSGATVFSAGTIEWAWGLAKKGVADTRVQTMTDNVLQHAGLQPVLTGDGFGAGSWPAADLSSATGSVSTFAGAAFQTGLVNGPAASARFNRPFGAAIDAQGNLYVADTGNCVLRKVASDAEHTVSTVVGDGHCGTFGPNNALELWYPTAVAVGGDGAVYVADTFNQRIVRLAPDGTASVFAGSPAGASGSADGTGTAARFNNPEGLAWANGALYVADTDNARIRRIDASGRVTTIAGSTPGNADGQGTSAQLYRPAGLAAGDGALWVMDVGNRLLRKIALDGTFAVTTVAGAPGGGFQDGPARSTLLMPWDGLFEQGGTLFFADTGNQRLRLLQSGQVHTLAGSGALGASDGPAASASLSLPTALLPLPDGRLLFVDNGSSTLRVLDRSH